MIWLCDIQANQKNLKIAFANENINVNDHLYNAYYHLQSPNFILHDDINSEYVIFHMKPVEDLFFQKGIVTFYKYDGQIAEDYITAKVDNIQCHKQYLKIICQTEKSYFKRRIGRLYSDIL